MPIVSRPIPVSEKRQHSLALVVAFLLIVRSQLFPDMSKVLGVSFNTVPRLGSAELEAAKQEVYRKECDGSISLFVPFRGRIAKVLAIRGNHLFFDFEIHCVQILGSGRPNKRICLYRGNEALSRYPLSEYKQESFYRCGLYEAARLHTETRLQKLAIQGSWTCGPPFYISRPSYSAQCLRGAS